MNTPPARITGIDLARGLAILGMIVAHVGADNAGPISRFFWLADGRPSALFAVLAGWGLHFMTSRSLDDDASLRRAQMRIVRRSLALAALGIGLDIFLPTPVAVILVPYAFMFILALPFLRQSPQVIMGSALGVILVGPLVVAITRYALDGIYYAGGTYIPLVHPLLTGYYPALTWLAYVLAGLSAGRLLHRRQGPTARGPWLLLATGIFLALMGYGGGLMAQQLTGTIMIPGTQASSLLEAYISVEPHSGSPSELLGNIGFALTVIAASLLLCRSRFITTLTFPIRATGMMSLSSYVLHLIIIFFLVLGHSVMEVIEPSGQHMLVLVMVPVVGFASIWAAVVGQGPLERALNAVTGGRTAR